MINKGNVCLWFNFAEHRLLLVNNPRLKKPSTFEKTGDTDKCRVSQVSDDTFQQKKDKT